MSTRLTFAGIETVKLNVRTPVRELVLNAAELEITQRFRRRQADFRNRRSNSIKAGNC